MELYVSGFNAWGQLHIADLPASETELAVFDDIEMFTSVLKANSISVRPFFSYTSITVNGINRIAGYLPSEHRKLEQKDSHAYNTMAEASNGTVAYVKPTGSLCQQNSLQDLLDGNISGKPLLGVGPCKQLVAYETGFMALTYEGQVYTWGDERYRACLGRESTAADEPGLVTALEDLPTGPIKKVAAGGYVLAALTEGNDLYLWGGHPGKKTIPADLSDEPAPVDFGEEDIADVAVGESHLLVATVSGRVFAMGTNSNAQIGLLEESAESWTHVDLNLAAGSRVVRVATGPRSSYIVVKKDGVL